MIAPALFLADEARPYCWLMEISGRKLGVHLRDGWCMLVHDQAHLINSESMCVHLLPVLELDVQDFLEFLAGVELRFPDYAASVRRFPAKSLLKHALGTSVGGYWPTKALAWLEDDPTMQQSVKAELEALARNKAMPQEARQRGRRMMRSLCAISV
ncbi:hypothetical protein [Duganella sp. HH105]|uniref:hypothetical protein n=1 Tax=Duganella sp. HH105 TaxID=1781067 RepID=UPI00114C8AF2|nr:hypothetical protein [Duganella sp. HH105]